MMERIYGLCQMNAKEEISAIDQRYIEEPYDVSGITKLQGAPFYLTGKDVLLGIIDYGFDLQHTIYKKSTDESRIFRYHDQSQGKGNDDSRDLVSSDETKAISNDDIRKAKKQDETGEYKHGTILSILAGGGATEAEFVLVELKQVQEKLREKYFIPEQEPAFEEESICEGLRFCEQVSAESDRPIVILLGLGTNMGDHGGKGKLEQEIHRLCQLPGVSVVVAAGNEGNEAHHYAGNLGNLREFSELLKPYIYTDVEILLSEIPQEKQTGVFFQFWGSLPDRFALSLKTPAGEEIPEIPMQPSEELSYKLIGEQGIIRIKVEQINSEAGEQCVSFWLDRPSEGIWTLRVGSRGELYSGIFHLWLPLTKMCTMEAKFLKPAPATTITSPSTVEGCIGVGFYHSATGALAPASGRGFNRVGQVQPTLAAPGVAIPLPEEIAVEEAGPPGRLEVSGSSAAAAITAAAVAQLMEYGIVRGSLPGMNQRIVKSMLIQMAERKGYMTYPNREWGYGSLRVDLLP